MNKLLFGLTSFSALIFAALLYSNSRTGMREQAYIQIGLNHYLEARLGRRLQGIGTENTSIYRYPENEAEIRLLFPECCRFARHDPEGAPIAGWKRHRYQFAGFVFIEAGQIKVSGDGRDNITTGTNVIALDKKGRDITRKIIPR